MGADYGKRIALQVRLGRAIDLIARAVRVNRPYHLRRVVNFYAAAFQEGAQLS